MVLLLANISTRTAGEEGHPLVRYVLSGKKTWESLFLIFQSSMHCCTLAGGVKKYEGNLMLTGMSFFRLTPSMNYGERYLETTNHGATICMLIQVSCMWRNPLETIYEIYAL